MENEIQGGTNSPLNPFSEGCKGSRTLKTENGTTNAKKQKNKSKMEAPKGGAGGFKKLQRALRTMSCCIRASEKQKHGTNQERLIK